MKIEILDCTLRDGGYVNNWNFLNQEIIEMNSFFNKANIDIVECGFLDTVDGKSQNCTRFKDISIINRILKNTITKKTLYVAMLEYGKYDVETLPMCSENNNEIKGIRFSFRKSDYTKVFDEMQMIIAKGYKLFIQPIATETYSDTELIGFINQCNQYNLYAFYIVDTHGSMYRDNLRRLYYLLNNNLKREIAIGFHSHNNLQLSYSNAIDFIEINKFSNRNIIIDSSVFGMGRGAGNLNTELVAGYLNRHLNTTYKIEPLLEIMDKYLLSIRQNGVWGYSLEHYLSATLNCHPNYASFLINQKNLDIAELKQLLELLPIEERREYNEKIISNKYIEYKSNINLKIKLPTFSLEKEIIVIGSGSSVKQLALNNKLMELVLGAVKIVLNHVSEYISHDYILFTNQARYNEFSEQVIIDNLIVTSNIKVKAKHRNCFVLDYKKLFELNDIKIDNVALLMLNYLISIGFKEVGLVGIDGFSRENSYSYNEKNRIVDFKMIERVNQTLIEAYSKISKKVHLLFLTDSLFKKHTKKKIVGIIPARYASTRLPGKPLLDICGLPMIIHVLKRVQLSTKLDEVIVATDDIRIYETVINFGGQAIMTDISHNNGSERLVEVSKKISSDIYVLINGDEALLNPKHINDGIESVLSSSDGISLLFNDFTKKLSFSDFKVVINRTDEIMYISRNDIPSNARNPVNNMYKAYHIMTFTKDFLELYDSFDETPLDYIESHELLRVLEYGYKIQGKRVESTAISVDTEEDLKHVVSVMKEDDVFQLYKDIIVE